MNSKFRLLDNKLVKYFSPTSEKTGDINLKKIISHEEKKELKQKLAVAFSKEIMNLSMENQEIILDDIVTAFENRLEVFTRKNLEHYFNTEDNIEFHCKPMVNPLEKQ